MGLVSGRQWRTWALQVTSAILLSGGCVYDYSALGGRPDDGGAAGAVGSGGRSGGAGGNPASGGSVGSGGAVAPGSGGRGTGGVAGAGSGGRGGQAGGGIGSGGVGVGGGVGGGHVGGMGAGGTAGGVAARLVLSIDFIGGRTVAPAAGGSTGVGGAGGGAAGAGGGVFIPAPSMAPSEVAGVKPASHWNGAPGVSGSLASLVLSNGVASAATVTWGSPLGATGSGVYTTGHADAPGDARMMNGYLDPLAPATPAAVVVGNLPAAIVAAGYDVYVYASGSIAGATTRTYRYTLGTVSITVSQTGPTPTTFPGFSLAPEGGAGNYVVFRNVAGDSFMLTATPGTGSPTRAPVNGIQIVSPPGS